MYPTITDFFKDVFGINIPLPIQTYGFFVALATLEFSLPIQANLVKPWPTQEPSLALADHSAIPAWLTAGIEAVATVRKHEHKQAVRAQALAGGLAAIALTKGHEERRLQERLVAAEAEIEALKRELAARPILPEADPGASRR